MPGRQGIRGMPGMTNDKNALSEWNTWDAWNDYITKYSIMNGMPVTNVFPGMTGMT